MTFDVSAAADDSSNTYSEKLLLELRQHGLWQVGYNCLNLPQSLVIPCCLTVFDSLEVRQYLSDAVVELADGAVLRLHAGQQSAPMITSRLGTGFARMVHRNALRLASLDLVSRRNEEVARLALYELHNRLVYPDGQLSVHLCVLEGGYGLRELNQKRRLIVCEQLLVNLEVLRCRDVADGVPAEQVECREDLLVLCLTCFQECMVDRRR